MQLTEGIRLALQQIRTEKLKSFFSLLGVIVGVMFLIVVVSIVEGLDRYITEDLATTAFGAHNVTLQRWGDGPDSGGSGARARQRRPRITYEDWEAVEEQITIPASVGAESNTGGEIVADNGQSVENVRIHAVSPEIMAIRDWVVEKGRTFSAQEAESWHRSRRARHGDRRPPLRESRSHRSPRTYPRIPVSRDRRPRRARQHVRTIARQSGHRSCPGHRFRR